MAATWLLFVPEVAHAADPATELRTLEQAWLDASRSRDVAALDRLLAPRFVHITYDGRVLSKRDALRAPVASPNDAQTLSQIAVRLYGRTAAVTGLNTVTAPDGTVEVRLRFTDVFVRLDGAWRAVSAQETLVRPAR